MQNECQPLGEIKPSADAGLPVVVLGGHISKEQRRDPAGGPSSVGGGYSSAPRRGSWSWSLETEEFHRPGEMRSWGRRLL